MRRDEPPDDRPRRRPPAARETPPWLVLAAACGLIAAVFVAAVAVTGGRRPAAAPAPAYTKMTADELFDEWDRNPAAAADKYRANGVEVTGVLAEVNTNVARQTYVTLRGGRGDGRTAHVFVLSARARAGLGGCAVGRPVTVRARSDGDPHPNPWLEADDVSP